MDILDQFEFAGHTYNICGLSSDSGATGDFFIQDENDNIVLLSKDGHIKTKNFDSSMSVSVIKMEHGGLNVDGTMDNSIDGYKNRIRSSYFIKANGASVVNGITFADFYVYEYDSNHVFIRISRNGKTFDDSCRYIKVTLSYENPIEKALFVFDGIPEETFNVQLNSGTNSNGTLKSEMLVFALDENNFTTARLLLPYNYDPDGDKVPLIIVDAGDGSFVSWDETIDHTASQGPYTTQMQYLADEGFAVLVVYTWGAYNYQHFPRCGMSGAIPTPVSILAHEKAVEYVTTRFNISDVNIFQISKSGSGKLSSYYAIHHPGYNLRSIYAFAPVIDGLNFTQWGSGFADFRKALDSEMNFTGDKTDFLSSDAWQIHTEDGITFVTENSAKFAKCTVINWQNLTGQTIAEKIADTDTFGQAFWDGQYWNVQPPYDIYNNYDLSIFGNGVPITIIAAPDDSSTPYMVMEEFVKQLQNGGNEANIVTLERGTGGHTAPDFGNPVSDVTTRSGVEYESVPYGWYYAVNDIFARFIHPEES